MRHLLHLLAAFSLVGTVACSSSSSSSGATSHTRSATCLQFQKSFCDWDADKCKAETRAVCDNGFQSLYCISDASAKACTDALATAGCGATPTACKSVADPAPAIDDCNQLISHYCSAAERCGKGSKSDCTAAVAPTLHCEATLGASPSIGVCFSALDALDCAAIGTGLPAACKGVVKQATGAPAGGSGAPASFTTSSSALESAVTHSDRPIFSVDP